MDWTEREEAWVSGSYAIELREPGKWALTDRSKLSESVEVDGEVVMTGHSLHAMKEAAESMEADMVRVRNRNRHLAIAALALLIFVGVAGGSGPIAAIVAIAAAGTAIYSLVRSFDLSITRRPWEGIPETYQ